MPTLKLNIDALVVESFPLDAIIPGPGGPRTREPGCTLPELCGTGREI
jgi:hypothetical protein